MNEEITFGLGLDTSQFGVATRKIIGMVGQMRESADGLKEGFNKALEVFGVGIGIGMLSEVGKKSLEFAESIRRGAEIAGTSTDFFQTLGAAMRESGGDSEEAARGLERLATLIGEAAKGTGDGAEKFKALGIAVMDANGNVRSTQEVWNELADRVAATSSASEAAATAAEVFGEKLGPRLVEALKMGSKGLAEFGKSVAKLSDDDIKQLHQLHGELESDANQWGVWAGKVVSHIATASQGAGRGFAMLQASIKQNGFFSTMGRLFTLQGAAGNIQDEFAPLPEKTKNTHVPSWAKAVGETKEYTEAAKALKKAQDDARTAGMKPEEKLAELQREREELQRQMDNIKGSTYERAHSVEMLKLEKEAVENIAKQENLRLEIADKLKAKHEQELSMQHEIANAREGLAHSEKELADKKAARSQLTIEELSSSRFRFGGQLGEDQATARRISQLQGFAEWNRLHGNLDQAKEQLSQADTLRNQLSSNVVEQDRHPWESMEESIRKQQENIAELLRKAGAEGLNVSAAMG